MGQVNVELTLKNAGDITRAADGTIKEQEIRQTIIKAVVNTGAGTLVINETIREKLGLSVKKESFATLGDGSKVTCQRTEPVEILWQNRSTTCHPVVLSNADEILLGVIPLEDMDLIVDPVRQTLAGAHGDEVVYMVR
jgi:clan AA aspartic protease